jgi:hypothetical protein
MTTPFNLIAGLPLCQIVSGANGGVIRVGTDLNCYVAASDLTDVSQLWQLVFFPDHDNSSVFVTQVSGVLYCLRAASGEQYAHVTPWTNDSSSYWQIGEGISPLRDSGYCLTMEGAGDGTDPWPVGTRIQIYEWQNGNYSNQSWSVQSVTPTI